MNETESKKNFSIIQVLYPGLILYYMFTLTETIFPLIRAIFQMNSARDSLLVLTGVVFWLSMFIQIVLAYSRGCDLYQLFYPVKALIADCIDIMLIVYVTTSVVQLIKGGGFDLLGLNTLHMTIPLFALSINQMWWFHTMKMDDKPARFRLCFLLVSMAILSILGVINKNSIIVYLITIVIVFCCMLFRIDDKAPKWFQG